ncbi:hypothetical protein LZ31DRAFT_543290 [Colletotrichum somersetense]|nr:hypothetical protein LZ31DRAFT_543290 [Colletotrichum somersetense]
MFYSYWATGLGISFWHSKSRIYVPGLRQDPITMSAFLSRIIPRELIESEDRALFPCFIPLDHPLLGYILPRNPFLQVLWATADQEYMEFAVDPIGIDQVGRLLGPVLSVSGDTLAFVWPKNDEIDVPMMNMATEEHRELLAHYIRDFGGRRLLEYFKRRFSPLVSAAWRDVPWERLEGEALRFEWKAQSNYNVLFPALIFLGCLASCQKPDVEEAKACFQRQLNSRCDDEVLASDDRLARQWHLLSILAALTALSTPSLSTKSSPDVLLDLSFAENIELCAELVGMTKCTGSFENDECIEIAFDMAFPKEHRPDYRAFTERIRKIGLLFPPLSLASSSQCYQVWLV